MIAFRLLDRMNFPPEEIAEVVTAIGNHDEGTGVPVSALAAALILADKSDVRRTRVRNPDPANFDIHDRVNDSVTSAVLELNASHTVVHLALTLDIDRGSVMEFFEIFMNRMILCRRAAQRLGLQFRLSVNGQVLL